MEEALPPLPRVPVPPGHDQVLEDPEPVPVGQIDLWVVFTNGAAVLTELGM